MKLMKLANPVTVTKGAVGLAGTAVGLAGSVTRTSAHLVSSGLSLLREHDQPVTDDWHPDAAHAVDVDVPSTEPEVVLAEPQPPAEPPVMVVEQALADEAALGDREYPDGAGLAHEPRGSSRDEEHGDAPLQRAELDEIAGEVEATLEGDVEPEEDHLTEPVLDPAEAKALAAEMATLRRAADPHKG